MYNNHKSTRFMNTWLHEEFIRKKYTHINFVLLLLVKENKLQNY